MNRIAKVVCVIALSLPCQLSADGRAASAQGASVGNRAVRANLEASAAWDAAFNSANLDAVMALYADGAVSMPPGFPALVGKPSIEADYVYLFENYGFVHQTTVMQLEIQGSLAVERGEYTMLIIPNDGSPAFVEVGKHIVVRREISGSWFVVEETWNTH